MFTDDPKLEAKLEKAAPKITAASVSKAKEVWAFFKMLFFPMLPGLIKIAVDKTTSTKDEMTLRQVRDILNAADLGDSE
jgi:hypothetical protein